MNKLVLMTLFSAGTLAQAQSRAASPEADLILVNGRILTVDAKDSVAEAVGIAGGRIVAVGSNSEVKKRAAEKRKETRRKRKPNRRQTTK